MDTNSITIKREDLYNEVWEMPITKLAKKYGLSDVGLAKICKKMEIPKPERGYWARLQNGYKVKQIPLKPLTEKGKSEVTIWQDLTGKASETKSNIVEVYTDLIVVPDKLINPHPLITKAKQHFSQKGLSYNDCINLKYCKEISFRATVKNYDRGLRIMNTILKTLEKLGHRVEVTEYYREYKTYAHIGNEKVAFMLEEVMKQIPHEPTKEELERKERWGYSYWHKHDHIPSNNYILSIEAWGLPRNMRFKWRDGKTRKIEDCLREFINGLYSVAHAFGEQRIEEQEKERLRKFEEVKRAELRELKEAELEKIKLLEEHIEVFHKSNLIRSYIKASKSLTLSPLQENLLKWAEEYANHLDPTKDFRISILDENC